MATQRLRSLWAGLQRPTDGSDLAFATVPIPGTPSVRLGRGRVGPALLMEQPLPGTPRANIELKNLVVLFNATCRVESGGPAHDGLFTVVSCTSPDANLHDLFIQALEPLLRAPEMTDPGALPALIDSLAELFHGLTRPPVTSVIGVWGELFLMTRAANPDLLLDSWHQLPNDRYDFASDSQRLEVKTTVGSRRHHLSLDQLSPPAGVQLVVCSIVTESTAAGSSVHDLMDEVASRCASSSAASRLVRGVAQALGSEVTEWSKMRYDTSRAAESLRLVRGDAVPRPGAPPPQVSDVRFVVDLTGVVGAPTGGTLIEGLTAGGT
jgi:hypothetical protein